MYDLVPPPSYQHTRQQTFPQFKLSSAKPIVSSTGGSLRKIVRYVIISFILLHLIVYLVYTNRHDGHYGTLTVTNDGGVNAFSKNKALYYTPPNKSTPVPVLSTKSILTYWLDIFEGELILFTQGVRINYAESIKPPVVYCNIGDRRLDAIEVLEPYAVICRFGPKPPPSDKPAGEDENDGEDEIIVLETAVHNQRIAIDIVTFPDPHKRVTERILSNLRFESGKHQHPIELLPSTLTSSLQYPHFACGVTQLWNVGKDLEDWLSYHAALGFTKFILYDNDSSDNFRDAITAFKTKFPKVEIEIMYWPWLKSQQAAFAHAKYMTEKECRWSLFFDVDEFVVPGHHCQQVLKTGNLQTLSTCFETLLTIEPNQNDRQVCLKSKVFGSSGHVTRPPGPASDNYIHRPPNETMYERLPKCFVQTGYALPKNVIHSFILREQDPPSSKPTTKTLDPSTMHLVHYKLRSWQDFIQKFSRPRNGPVTDWNITIGSQAAMLERPPKWWSRGHLEIRNTTVEDTEFRDFKRLVMGAV